MMKFNEDKKGCDTCVGCTPTMKLFKCMEEGYKHYINKGELEVQPVTFMLGDEVFDGVNGVVSSISASTSMYPLIVSFENAMSKAYTIDGYETIGDRYRSLYHGHNLPFSNIEVLPFRPKVREVWVVSVYDTDFAECCTELYKDKQEAIEYASKLAKGCILLTPPYKAIVPV